MHPGSRLGPCEITASLGAGAMGEVYRAHDRRLGREVAIKVVAAHATDDPQARERFEREARSVARLQHPNICTVYDVGDAEGRPFIVMELLHGESLQHGRDVTYASAFALALAGDVTRSEKLANDLARQYPRDTLVEFTYVPAVRALAALARNQPAAALALLRVGVSTTQRGAPSRVRAAFAQRHSVNFVM